LDRIDIAHPSTAISCVAARNVNPKNATVKRIISTGCVPNGLHGLFGSRPNQLFI
uniref:Alcohol dehydrogenase n=1 Tax=Schistosoma curassoni TaxID=6186 RepID=A0A183JBG5_9TREM